MKSHFRTIVEQPLVSKKRGGGKRKWGINLYFEFFS
jgi:hypothetical protein